MTLDPSESALVFVVNRRAQGGLNTAVLRLFSVLGDLVAEDRGKTIGLRILPDGKMEQTGQGTGKWWGIEATNLSTNLAAMRPDGTFSGQGDGLIMTKDGDTMAVRIYGIGRPTGQGSGVSYRGTALVQSATMRFAQATKQVLVFEFESDEKGDYLLKVWEWK